MIGIKKGYNLKIVLLIAGFMLLFGASSCMFSFVYAEENLRIPINDYDRIVSTFKHFIEIADTNDAGLIKEALSKDIEYYGKGREARIGSVVNSIQEGKKGLFIARDNETSEIFGYELYEPLKGGTVWIRRVFVYPEYKRRGIGAFLIEHAVKDFKNRFNRIEVKVNADENIPAEITVDERIKSLFIRLGFTERRYNNLHWEKTRDAPVKTGRLGRKSGALTEI
jgi:GNAT superfamily N-acetyltransferase